MQVQKNFDLSRFNTLQLISTAEYFVELQNLQDLKRIIQNPEYLGIPWRILGGGSNLVLPSFIKGLVVKLENKGRELITEDSDHWWIKAQAGEVWHEFVLWTLEKGFWGLENLSLIPGTVGAAPIQNIGAYGVEIKDFIDEVHCVDLKTGQHQIFKNCDCQFAYRESVFKKSDMASVLVWEVVFRLPKKNTLQINYGDIQNELKKFNTPIDPKKVSEAVINIRNSKLPNPKVIGNAGSFFKNPIVSAEKRNSLISIFPTLVSYPYSDQQYKLAAGWLIEQVGWKGKKLGPVGMFEKQALVLVNHGNATADDVWNVASQVAHDVFEKFGVIIEPEPIKW